MNEIFSRWKEKLLDLSKGNPLINFKKPKTRSLRILLPEIQKTFAKITISGELNFFDTSDYLKYLEEPNCELKSETAITDFLISNTQSDIKNDEIVVYNHSTKTNIVIRNLKKLSSDAMFEKGVNILYIAFGFLNWKHNGDKLFSPIILCPVQINTNGITLSEEDEIITNPTLIYKLKSELNIDLPEFNPDENDDISTYLKNMSDIFRDKDWDICDDMYISTFSFLKMNIYKDYDENEEKILKNPDVRSMLFLENQSGTENAVKVEDINKFFQEGKDIYLHNIVDADSSQQEAIIKAKNGESFVLQGPPGTGKSQTITNLIAEFLYDGKKVLFVSEKLAALNVVFDKLKKAGLEDFCLELHSHKTNKKIIIDELVRVLNKPKISLSPLIKQEIEELISDKKILDDYCNELHKEQGQTGLSVFRIINLLGLYESLPTFDFVIRNKNTFSEETIKYVVNKLDQFGLQTKNCNDYRLHSWHGYKAETISYEEMYNLKQESKKISDYFTLLMRIILSINEKFGIKITNYSDARYYCQILKIIQDIGFYSNVFFNKDYVSELYNSVVGFNKLMANNLEMKKQVDELFDEGIYSLDTKQLYIDFKKKYKNIVRLTSINYLKTYFKVKKLRKSRGTKVNYDSMIKVFYVVTKIKDTQQELKKLLAKIYSILKIDESTDISFTKFEKNLFEINKLLINDKNIFNDITKSVYDENKGIINEYLNIMDNSVIYDSVCNLQKYFNEDILNIQNSDIVVVINRLNKLVNSSDDMVTYIPIRNILSDLKEYNLDCFVDRCIDNQISPDTYSDTFLKMFYEQYIYDVFALNDVFKNFSQEIHNKVVQKFGQKDKVKFDISKSEIISSLTKKIPDISNCIPGSQISTLLREANKKRKKKPVRILLQEITELIQIIKPCFLMSPLSVSTFLTSDDCTFDVVIFDEASQIAPSDAICSIYRAKQTIIVGDSKQMPPSDFFNYTTISDDYEEDDSVDFESILDLAVSSFPQTFLRWHYRSKTEDLITFSNKNFYNNNLNTFPSVIKDNQDIGIDFIYVDDGIFDRNTRTNYIEALEVVDLIKHHYALYPERSLGVVAFSISQQQMIDEILNNELVENFDLAQKIMGNTIEPFFIKNLETVQGDERDTIILSVGYGNDIDGRFIHNFGPLNRKGGERRLNVAITRAKYNLKIVSSITDNDIDLSKSEATGTKLLKEFLFNARTKINCKDNSLYENIGENYILDEIGKYLEEKGYNIKREFGNSEKKIAMVVKNKDNKYTLAIETDDEDYKNYITTRDRDRLRQSILESMGWKYYRVWSAQWAKNKDKIFEEIINILEDDESQNKINDFSVNSESFMIENISDNNSLRSNFEIYKRFDISKISNTYRTIEDKLYMVIEHEQPVTAGYLYEICYPFVKYECGTLEKFIAMISMYKKIVAKDNYYTLNTDAEISLRVCADDDVKRNITDISDAEIMAGIIKVIELNVGVSEEELIKIIAELIGYKRINPVIRQKVTDCISLLVNDGRICMQNDRYVLKS